MVATTTYIMTEVLKARAKTIMREAQAGLTVPAVAGQLERGVRPQANMH
jgi:hypothetical protein